MNALMLAIVDLPSGSCPPSFSLRGFEQDAAGLAVMVALAAMCVLIEYLQMRFGDKPGTYKEIVSSPHPAATEIKQI